MNFEDRKASIDYMCDVGNAAPPKFIQRVRQAASVACLLIYLERKDTMGFMDKAKEASSFSVASGQGRKYVVLQVTLKEKFLGTGSGNLTELEDVINSQAEKGYRLHTISTASGGSKGIGGGDRIQATLVFERIY